MAGRPRKTKEELLRSNRERVAEWRRRHPKSAERQSREANARSVARKAGRPRIGEPNENASERTSQSIEQGATQSRRPDCGAGGGSTGPTTEVAALCDSGTSALGTGERTGATGEEGRVASRLESLIERKRSGRLGQKLRPGVEVNLVI